MATEVNTSTQQYFGFDPRTIPTCVTWLDAQDESAFTFSSGSNVSQWRNKAVNATPAFAAGTPTRVGGSLQGYTSVSLGTNNYFAGGVSGLLGISNLSYFVVGVTTAAQPRVGSDQRLISLVGQTTLDTNTACSVIYNPSGTSTLTGLPTGVGPISCALVQNTPFLVGVIYTRTPTGGPVNLFLNGASVSSSSLTGVFNIEKFSIGYKLNQDPNTDFWFGNVGEVIIYSTAITGNQRQQLEGYLAWKWGLQGNLPLSHQFKYNPTTMRLLQPIDVESCVTWLDASDPGAFTFSSGSNIASWIDRSGSNNTATEISTTRPTWSSALSAVVMTSSSSNFIRGTLSATFSSNATVFFVGSYISNASSIFLPRAILLGNSAAPGTDPGFVGHLNFVTQSNPPFMGAYVNNATNPTGRGINIQTALDISYSTGFIYTNAVADSLSAGTITFAIDTAVDGRTQSRTSTVASSTTNVVTFNKYALGAYLNTAPNPGDCYNGNIHECLIYSSRLTQSQRHQIEGYLAWKWNLYSRLATTHPFKNFPSSTALFNPLFIPNIAMWLDAQDPAGNGVIPANGSSITTWVDKARVNNMTATGTVTYQSNPSRLVMNNSYMSNSSTASLTAFIVYKQTGTTGPVFTTNNLDVTGLFPNEVGTTYFARSNTTWAIQTSTIPTNSINLLAIDYRGTGTGSTMNLWLNGALNITSTTTGTITRDRFTLAFRSLNSQYMLGEYHEVILFGVPFASATRQQIEGYLAWKWGLQNNLPTTHPYYKFRP